MFIYYFFNKKIMNLIPFNIIIFLVQQNFLCSREMFGIFYLFDFIQKSISKMKLKLILTLVLILALLFYQGNTDKVEDNKKTVTNQPYIQTNTFVHALPNTLTKRPPTIAECPCATQASSCPPCPAIPSYTPSSCGCAPQPDCPRCLLNKSIKLIHQVAAHEVQNLGIERSLLVYFQWFRKIKKMDPIYCSLS